MAVLALILLQRPPSPCMSAMNVSLVSITVGIMISSLLSKPYARNLVPTIPTPSCTLSSFSLQTTLNTLNPKTVHLETFLPRFNLLVVEGKKGIPSFSTNPKPLYIDVYMPYYDPVSQQVLGPPALAPRRFRSTARSTARLVRASTNCSCRVLAAGLGFKPIQFRV